MQTLYKVTVSGQFRGPSEVEFFELTRALRYVQKAINENGADVASVETVQRPI